MLRAVFFDLDDTLIDQKTAASAAVIAWAADHGVTDHGVSRRWASISEANYERYSRRELTFDEQRRERVREFLNAEVDDHEADELFGGYLIRYEARWASFEDAVPALGRARKAGLTVAVLTNGDENHQRMKLQNLGLVDAVDVLVASSMLPAGKPDPRAFSHALEIVGVDAGGALMVGDSLENDVLGALDAGLDAVLLDRDGAHTFADVRRIQSLDELNFAAPAAL